MRILLATNGSVSSERALRLGAQIGRRARKTPTVLIVTTPGSKASPDPEAVLQRAREILSADEIEVTLKVRSGKAAPEIVAEAGEGDYDLVIVGEGRGGHGLNRKSVGSTAMRVVEEAPCPVLVAKGEARSIRRILLCDSGLGGLGTGVEPHTSLVQRFMARLADLLAGDETVTILHVMSQISAAPGVRGKQLRASADELMRERAPEGDVLTEDVEWLDRARVQPRAEVRHGLVVDEILKEARSGNYDLVVIGAHRGEPWQRLLLEDLACKIVQRIDRPVLVVR
jgi:nucleotide-binding universal stress UspA family protein